jgi:hypothetical protein
VKPLVQFVDHALPAGEFRRLRAAVKRLGRERLSSSYQTTFWFDLDQPPSTLVEGAALRCVRHLPSSRTRNVAGVEWWLSRMRTSNVKVDFHRDRDNALFDDTGRTVSPSTSSVLYLTTSVGGLLAVTREPANPANPACAPDAHDFDLVAPAPNRFVFFDGALTHGVLDARNRIPAARIARATPWRVGIAINFWRRRPRRVPAFQDTSHYRALALGPPGE